MPNVHAVVLAQMRAHAEQLLTDTCLIEVREQSYGPGGEPLETYATVASGVSCRVIDAGDQLARRADTVADRETITDLYQLITPYGTALAVDQRVTLTSDSSVYYVMDLRTERTDKVDAQATISRVN